MTTDVVLLHGWPGLPSDWDEVRLALGPSYTSIAPDLAGFGAAFVPGEPVDARAETHAQAIIELIPDRRLDRPVVAGYDIGTRDRAGVLVSALSPAAVVGRAARRQPRRAAYLSVVLLDAMEPPRRPIR
jgi:pimeloyl-ACP methyl ester carboxylesterase